MLTCSFGPGRITSFPLSDEMFWSDNSWKQTRSAVDENAFAEVSGLQTCNSFCFWEFWQFGVFLNTSLLLRQCRFHGRGWTFPTWVRWGKFIPEGHPEFRGAALTETHSETHSDTVQVSTCRASWPQNLAVVVGGFDEIWSVCFGAFSVLTSCFPAYTVMLVWLSRAKNWTWLPFVYLFDCTCSLLTRLWLEVNN